MEVAGYILFYIGTGLIVPLFATPQRGKLYSSKLVAAIIIFCIVRGFVYDTGTDYMDYYDYYVDGVSANSEHVETFYKVLVVVLSSICSHPFLFFAFCAFLNTYAMLEIGHYYENSQRQVLLLWPLFMLGLSLNLYRQYIALAFIILLYVFLQRKLWFKSIICAIIAVGFHTSSIIGIFFIGLANQLSHYKINKWIFVIAIVIATFASNFFLNTILGFSTLVSIYYQQYTGQLYDAFSISESMYTSNTLLFANMIVGCILILCMDKIVGNSREYRPLLYLFAIGQILMPIMREQILVRICLYITVFTPVILGITLKKCRFNKLSGITLMICILYYFSYFIYSEYHLWKLYPLKFDL